MSNDDIKGLFKTPFPGEKNVIPLKPRTAKEELEFLQAEEDRLRKQIELPFLYGWKWYKWARTFFESQNKINLLCAANQISKSSTQIRKCIHWATAQDLWPELWERAPIQFWYLYPTKAQVSAEFETKWKQFLPKGEMKKDPYYGWEVERKNGDIIAIHFNSGVHVYFKTYAQNASALQSGTCDAIFCDEELPVDLYEELMFRISASAGYFHMVFTATSGQDFWRRCLEPEGDEKEELPDALKLVVSLYEAMEYEDGTKSHWTIEKIKMVEARCSTHNEVLKRVFGKFIVLGGRKYEEFDIKRHLKKKHPVPSTWLIYVGADIGSGGAEGHKAALCYVAVSPDFRQGRVFLGWRGPENVVTTAGDVVQKHIDLKKEHKLTITQQFYDWASVDFYNIATRLGEPFEKAEKSHDIGENFLNTLFKNNMLYIYEDEELVKLAGELATLKKTTNKRQAKDDFSDALRYAVTRIPWDWTAITGAPVETDEKPEEQLTEIQRQVKERRQAFSDENETERLRIEDEFNEWNEAYDG